MKGLQGQLCHRHVSLAWLSIAALCLGHAIALEVYVSCSDDSSHGNGSATEPYSSISDAVSAMGSSGVSSYVVNIAPGAVCSGPSNTEDIHIPSTVSSIEFIGSDSTLECSTQSDGSGITFHYSDMGSFTWRSIHVRYCPTLVHGSSGQSHSSLALYSSNFTHSTGDLLRLTNIQSIRIESCHIEEIDGSVMLAHTNQESSLSGSVAIIDSQVEHCTAGIVLNGYTDVHISSCSFVQVAGAISVSAHSGEWLISECEFSQCSTEGYGGAINAVGLQWNITDSTLTLSHNRFTSCSALWGGAVYANGGVLRADNCTFEANTASFGGAIAMGAIRASLAWHTCLGNEASALGGCLYLNQASTATFSGESLVQNNKADAVGAAFACNGPDNLLLIPDSKSDATLTLVDNIPEEFENACVDEYYDSLAGSSPWYSSHWLLLAMAAIGTCIVGAVLVVFLVFEALKLVRARRGQSSSEEDSSDEEEMTTVEYDFSQPAAQVEEEEE